MYALRPMRRPLMRDPRLLIDWRAGEPFPSGGYTRPSDGLTRGTDGVWRPCAPGVPRTTWGTDPVTGLLVPRYLTEPGGENLIPWSGDFTKWTRNGDGIALTGAHALGWPVWRLVGGSDHLGVHTPVVVTGGESYTLWAMARAAEGSRLRVRWGSPFSLQADFDLATGTISAATQGVTPMIRPAGDEFWLCSVTIVAPSTASAGVAIYDTSGVGIDILVGQVEPGVTPTSYIPTAGAPATRDRDTLYFDLPDEVARPGTPLAIYARLVKLFGGSGGGGGFGLWGIESASGSAPSLDIYHSGDGGLRYRHRNGVDTSTASHPAGIDALDLVESLSLVWTDDDGNLVGRLIARVLPAGSSQWGPIHAAPLPPLEPAPEWSARRLYIGSRGRAPGVYGWERLAVWDGIWAGDDARLLARARGEI